MEAVSPRDSRATHSNFSSSDEPALIACLRWHGQPLVGIRVSVSLARSTRLGRSAQNANESAQPQAELI